MGNTRFTAGSLTFDDVKAAYDLRLISVTDAWDALDDVDSPRRAAARETVCARMNNGGFIKSTDGLIEFPELDVFL